MIFCCVYAVQPVKVLVVCGAGGRVGGGSGSGSSSSKTWLAMGRGKTGKNSSKQQSNPKPYGMNPRV